jgi:polysaccharide biosynthesis protein PslG
MNSVSRRAALQMPVLALAAQAALPRLEAVGKVKPRPGKSIAASPLSVGFECLDRHMFEPEQAYAHVAALGVKWARVQTGWARTERTKGEFDFRWLDGIVDALRSGGVQPWFNVGYGNTLYTPGSPNEYAVGFAPVFSPEAKQAWVRFVSRLAEHFRNRVTHYEIWNEPDIVNFWAPSKPSPDDYAGLVKLTAPEIRKRVPKAVIVAGGISGLPRSLGYVERCFEQGIAAHIDKFSYHAYRGVPEENYDQDVAALRRIVQRHGARIGLWQGECGCPSAPKGVGALSQLDWTEERQAKWMLRRTLSDLKMGVELSSYFHMVDLVKYHVSRPNEKPGGAYFGLLRVPGYAPKPSYAAYQCLCALFDAETKRDEYAIDFSSPSAPYAVTGIYSATFLRTQRPLCTYWYPASLMQPYTAATVNAAVWTGSRASLPDPVVIDPLEGTAYKPARVDRRDGGWVHLPGLPLLDYPLLITDRSVLA